MERDPVRLAWRYGKVGHILVFGLVLLCAPIAFFVIDLPRQIVADGLADPAARAPLLQLAYDWPLLSRDPDRMVLFEGFTLSRPAYLATAAALLIAAFALRALAHIVVDTSRGRNADGIVAGLSRKLVKRLMQARTVNGLDAPEMMAQSAADLLAIRPFLAQAITGPVFAGARIVLAIVYAAWLDPRLGGVVVLAALVLTGLSRWRRATQAGRQREEAARARRLATAQQQVVGHWRAIRAYGAFDDELAAFSAAARLPRPQTGADVARRLRDSVADLVPILAPALAGLVAAGSGFSVPTAIGALIATALLPMPVRLLARWRDERREAETRLARISEYLGALHARREPDGATAPRIADSKLAINGLLASDAASGISVGPLDVKAEGPVHIAIVTPGDQEADVLAATIAGLTLPASGNVALAGLDPATVPAQTRAAKIAFSTADPVIKAGGSWLDNLTYGIPAARRAAIEDDEIVGVLRAVGLDRQIDARALGAPVDPSSHPILAAAVLPARIAVHERLREAGLADLVERFDPDLYNPYATVAENMLFGVPVGDTFDASHLAGHPFFRAVMEAEDFGSTLTEMGLSIASTVTEMFAGIPDGHPLFTRFAFMAADERDIYEDLVARRSVRRRGEGAARDRDRLIALALRYIETRHRLGLVDDKLEAKLLSARRTFAKLLPPALKPAIDFYDPASLCRAATFADNLLFGRIAYDVAGAEAKVGATVWRVIGEQGLERAVTHLGLSTAVDGQGSLRPDIAGAIDLGRALLRRPEALIAARPGEGLDPRGLEIRLGGLREAMSGRTLIALFGPDIEPTGFDQVIRLDTKLADPAAAGRA